MKSKSYKPTKYTNFWKLKMNGVTLLESSWRFSSIFCEKNCIVKSCTKTGRVRLRWSEGEKGKKGGKAAGCMVNALFICLAELKLQVCLRLLWIKEMGDALQYCLPTQQKSNLFFPSSLQKYIEWYPDSKEQLQTWFWIKHFLLYVWNYIFHYLYIQV